LLFLSSAMINAQAPEIWAPSTLTATRWGSRVPPLVAPTSGMPSAWPAPIPRPTGPALRTATPTSSPWWVHSVWKSGYPGKKIGVPGGLLEPQRGTMSTFKIGAGIGWKAASVEGSEMLLWPFT
jgi:hypothetical protein